MNEKRLINIVVEDDFGRVQTKVKSDLLLSDLMDKILRVVEND